MIHGVKMRNTVLRWLSVPANGNWSERVPVVTHVLGFMIVTPSSGEMRLDPDETVQVQVQNSIVFSAPVGALQRRWLQFTQMDDYFGTRALWFMAEDLQAACTAEPTRERLRAVAKYIRGVREEFAKYFGAVAGSPIPWVIPVGGLWRIDSRCAVPLVVEVVTIETRDVRLPYP